LELETRRFGTFEGAYEFKWMTPKARAGYITSSRHLALALIVSPFLVTADDLGIGAHIKEKEQRGCKQLAQISYMGEVT